MYYNTTGGYNAAVGWDALNSNTTGSYNTAIGVSALQYNTTASNNTAVGYQAGYSNTTGFSNTFVGYQAGYTTNRTDSLSGRNVFVGEAAGYANTTGRWNSFFGHYSGSAMTTGSSNTIIGRYDGNQNGLDIRTASNYIVLSDGDGNPRGIFDSSGNFNAGGTAEFGARISSIARSTGGRTLYLSKATGDTTDYFLVADTVTVNRLLIDGTGTVNNATGTYGTISDIKLKENVVDATSKLDDVMALKVRNFNYKIEPDNKQLGFIAQEIEQIFPTLVAEHKDTDKNGNDLGTITKSVKTSILIPILVKAMQEQQALIESLTARLTALESK
jgi:hypothetical protein